MIRTAPRACSCGDTSGCRYCWFYANDPAVRALAGGDPPLPATEQPQQRARHPRRNPVGAARAAPVAAVLPPDGRIEWAYGVTTVPARRETLLPQTLACLAAAGFPKPHLFVDGGTPLVSGCEATCRTSPVGAWGNWALGMAELLIRHPKATRLAIFQDDLLCSANLRAYLDAQPFPERGYWNLYTALDNEALVAGQAGWARSDQRGRGALALVFDRAGAVRLLTHADTVRRPQSARKTWPRNIDGWVAQILCNDAGYTEYVHAPSLVQHAAAHASTLGHIAYEPARTFRGEGFDALDLLPEGAR